MAWSKGRGITALDYLAAVRHMAARLPQDAPVLNLCSKRHHFAVVLGAALLRGVPLLLPSTRTPEMLQRLGQRYPGLHAVVDAPGDSGGLPQIVYERGPLPAADAPFEVPEIDGAQIAAYVFTSGSTGEPMPHAKHWGPLVQNAQGAGRRVREWLGTDQPFTVTGTVPPQHMYGFESTVLLPLLNESVIDASHPFYPADIAAALQDTPGPRVLVSTPFHLRTLVEAQLAVPPLSLLLSATAPLAPQLARQAEEALGAPLLEIYGSTETGQIAARRCSAGDLWQTFDGIEVQAEPVVDGEPRFQRPWRPRGRRGAAERRTGVAVPHPLRPAGPPCRHGQHRRQAHLAGLPEPPAEQHPRGPGCRPVLAAGRDPGRAGPHPAPDGLRGGTHAERGKLQHAMRERIDPAFLPRPIHFLPVLPRNATGKLPQQVLAQLAQQAAQERGTAHATAPMNPPGQAARWKPAPFVQVSLGVHALAGVGLLTPAWPLSLGALAANHALIAATGLWPRSHWLGPNLTHLPRQRPEVALTIDDGPNPRVTPAVLDLLDTLQAKATFFCIGEPRAAASGTGARDRAAWPCPGQPQPAAPAPFFRHGAGPVASGNQRCTSHPGRRDRSAPASFSVRQPACATSSSTPCCTSWACNWPAGHGAGSTPARGMRPWCCNASPATWLPATSCCCMTTMPPSAPAGRPVILEVLPPLLAALRAQGLQRCGCKPEPTSRPDHAHCRPARRVA